MHLVGHFKRLNRQSCHLMCCSRLLGKRGKLNCFLFFELLNLQGNIVVHLVLEALSYLLFLLDVTLLLDNCLGPRNGRASSQSHYLAAVST